MTIFAISGKVGSGKDTLGLLLKAQLVLKGYPVDKMMDLGFADKLKEAGQLIFGLSAMHFNDHEWKNQELNYYNGLTPRTIAQKLGTEVARSIYKDIWVSNYNRTWREFQNDFIFTTDLRFQNELEYLEDLNKDEQSHTVIFIKIERKNKSLNKEQSKHASENGITDNDIWDYEINNNDTLDELNQIAEVLINDEIIND